MLLRNVNNKKCAPKFLFFKKRKCKKIRMIFEVENHPKKVRFRYFLTPPHYTNSQNSMISFDYCWFLAKNLSNFVYLSWKLPIPHLNIVLLYARVPHRYYGRNLNGLCLILKTYIFLENHISITYSVHISAWSIGINRKIALFLNPFLLLWQKWEMWKKLPFDL